MIVAPAHEVSGSTNRVSMPTNGDAKEHRTASRVTAILELAARSYAGVRLGDIATALDAPRSSVHGLMKGLAATGYVREDDGRYHLGPAVGALLAAPSPAPPEIAAVMARLCAELDETVTLVSQVGRSVVYTHCVETKQPVRYTATLRVRRPLYPTSSGKCFLAFGTDRFRNAYLSSEFPNHDVRAAVTADLNRVSADGVAVNRAETLPDLYAVSAPIFDSGMVVKVLTVAGPSGRFINRLDTIVSRVKSAVGSIQ